VTLDQFRATELASDGFAVARPSGLAHRTLGAQLVLDYTFDAAVFEGALGNAGTEHYAVVQHHLVGTANVAYGLWDRVTFFAGLPVSLVMTGESAPSVGLPEADGTLVGDPLLGARVLIFGGERERFSLGAQLGLSLPLASAVRPTQLYAGEGTVVALPRVVGEMRTGRVRANLQLGARLRGPQTVDTLDIGQELTYGAAFVVAAVPERLSVHVEVFGAATLGPRNAFARESSPVEALAGAKYRWIPCVSVGLAGGTGLSRGYGAPDVRGVASVGYTGTRCRPATAPMPAEPFEPEPELELDEVATPVEPEPARAPTLEPEPETCASAACLDTSDRIEIRERIEFAPNSATIDPSSLPVLASVRAILESNPHLGNIVVEGHTDAIGDPARNRQLSQRRAQAVVSWLVEQGIDAGRLEARGAGSDRPIASDDTAEGRRSNRRVELHVVH
jgi:outer membrane protein OmpA-like peptidoglycan-associated protein